MLLSAELLLATTGILSTSIGAGIYLTGYTHDIKRDPMLAPIKGLRLGARLRLRRMNRRHRPAGVRLPSLAKPKMPPVPSLVRHIESAFAPQYQNPTVGPELRSTYEARSKQGEWYGNLRGVPLDQIISSYTRLPLSRIYEAKVYEDKVRDGHVLSWIELGERDRRGMFLPNKHLREHMEFAR